MILLETVVQGIGGSGPARSLPLSQGYNVFLAPSPRAGEKMAALVLSTLFPQPQEPSVPPQGKVGLLLQSAQDLLKLFRDFDRQAVSLHRKDERGYQLLSKNTQGVMDILSSQLHWPRRDLFTSLFVVAPFASQRPPPGQDEDLSTIKEQLFALEDRLREAQEGGQRLTYLREQIQALGPIDRLPEGLDQALRAYDQEVAYRDEKIALLEEEEVGGELVLLEPEPLTRDPLFLAGLAVSTVALSLGLILGGSLRWIALLNMPALGISAWRALRFIAAKESMGQSHSQSRIRGSKREALQRRFEKRTQLARSAMDRLGLTSSEEIRARLDKYRELTAELGRVEAGEASPSVEELQGQIGRLQERERAIEERAGSFDLSDGPSNSPSWLTSTAAPSMFSQENSPSDEPSTPQGLPLRTSTDISTMLNSASDLFCVPPSALLSQGQGLLGPLREATEGRIASLRPGPTGSLLVADSSGQAQELEALSQRDLSWLALTLQVTFARLQAASHPFPLVLLPGLLPEPLELVGPLLADLGTKTQVLHFTTTQYGELARYADAVIDLSFIDTP